MQYITENEIDRIAGETGRQLAKEKRVRVTVQPVDGKTHWEGGVNGHFFRIRTGVQVSVPESLARLIAGSAKVRAESEQRTGAYRKSGGKRVG